MIGKMIGAAVGKRVAGRHGGTKGMLAGAAAPWLLSRLFTPLGLAVAGGYAAKKFYDSRKRKNRGPDDYVKGGRKRR